MNNTKNQISDLYINALYDQLLTSIKDGNKKVIMNSILLTLMKLSSNDTFKFISRADINFPDGSLRDLKILEQNSYIKRSEDTNKPNGYVITARGIYYVESEKIGLDFTRLLDFIQNEKMDFPIVNKPLKDSEKSIILSLIGLRAFSDDATMDLNSEGSCEKWKEIIEGIVCPYLLRKGAITNGQIFNQKTGNEHPTAYLMRRANDLPKKTNNMFFPSKRNQYYLMIDYRNQETTVSQISYLLGKVFQTIDSVNEANEMHKFLCMTAHDQALYVMEKLDFISFQWDKIIEESVEKIFLGID